MYRKSITVMRAQKLLKDGWRYIFYSDVASLSFYFCFDKDGDTGNLRYLNVPWDRFKAFVEALDGKKYDNTIWKKLEELSQNKIGALLMNPLTVSKHAMAANAVLK